jgi:hypothetical protein
MDSIRATPRIPQPRKRDVLLHGVVTRTDDDIAGTKVTVRVEGLEQTITLRARWVERT